MAPNLRAGRERGASVIERKYLTFDELAERWNCDKRDIHYLIAERDLAPSIAWGGMAVSCQWEPDPEGHEQSILCSVKDDFGNLELRNLHGWVYLKLPTVSGPFENYYFSYASYELSPTWDEFRPGVIYRLVSSGEYNLTESVSGSYVEQTAVFMLESVEGCETVLHPSIGDAVEKRNRSRKIVEQVEAAELVPNKKGTLSLRGACFDRLQRAVTAFPTRYPDFSIRQPKLDSDVRVWLKEAGLAANNTEQRVFGTIIAEHFKLSPDSQKIQ